MPMEIKMKILITGSNGFVGKNLIERLNKDGYHDITIFDIENSLDELKEFSRDTEFIYHFAAVHRPKDNSEYYKTNAGLTETLMSFLEENGNNCPVLLTSSIQANDKNDYGESKRGAEKAVREHSLKTGAKTIIYQLTNTFGKWAMPNHHSVVATFCYNIARDFPVSISNPNHIMNLYYIDDVIDDFLRHLKEEVPPNKEGYYKLTDDKVFEVSLGKLAELITNFKNNTSIVFNNKFEEHLYNTYLTYKPN
jgi:UDP-2-acetamido-2,6-beta-L-arabino-hexul-4-ose reductase